MIFLINESDILTIGDDITGVDMGQGRPRRHCRRFSANPKKWYRQLADSAMKNDARAALHAERGQAVDIAAEQFDASTTGRTRIGVAAMNPVPLPVTPAGL